MKRRDLTNHLAEHGCELLREGSRYSVYVNRRDGKSSAIPRHREISDILAAKICADPGVPRPRC
ncbi:MAG: addiction module toxin, HicA family [Dehalococcoidia bacterium]|nr:addiction module toxin, HicA family [Dehalococcoidia bacterium]